MKIRPSLAAGPAGLLPASERSSPAPGLRRGLALAALLLAIGCSTKPVHSSQAVGRQLNVAGNERDYFVYRPASLPPGSPAPLVVVLHGGWGNGPDAERSYAWDEVADSGRFVLVYPNGMNKTWNAGGLCCGPARIKRIDDVGFLNRLLETVVREEGIDPQRVYLTGISNGAAMAYRYACEGDYPIAGVGAVAGSMSASCQPRPGISLLAIHGTADEFVPFTGGPGIKEPNKTQWLPIGEVVSRFRRAADCAAPVTNRQGDVQTSVAACAGRSNVALVTIDGAGHQWPGGRGHNALVTRILELDTPSRALDATKTLWHFFDSGEVALEPAAPLR